MTLPQFLESFKFKSTGTNTGDKYVIETKALRRSDDKIIGRLSTSIDISDMQDVINDSQSPFSATPWDWESIIDQTIRGQLDFFAQKFPIDEFFPMNSKTDISYLE
jgi:asparagine synthetase A